MSCWEIEENTELGGQREMARFRQIHVEFWQDGFVLDLTPEEKYFYLYLMTNSKTTQCGIYELPKRIIETESGYNRETVDKLLQRFTDYGKISYHEPTKEIMILNWIKFNWIKSPKVMSLIKKELKAIKNREFIRVFKDSCIEYGYGIDTLGIDLGEERELERELEREEEVEREEEQEVEPKSEEKDQVSSVVRFWDDNGFGYNNMQAKNQLLLWLDDSKFKHPCQVILKALAIACENNVRRLKYVEGILRNWENESLLTIEEIEISQAKKDNNPNSQLPPWKQAKQEPVPKWMGEPQKEVETDPDELEKAKREAAKYRELLSKKKEEKQRLG